MADERCARRRGAADVFASTRAMVPIAVYVAVSAAAIVFARRDVTA